MGWATEAWAQCSRTPWQGSLPPDSSQQHAAAHATACVAVDRLRAPASHHLTRLTAPMRLYLFHTQGPGRCAARAGGRQGQGGRQAGSAQGAVAGHAARQRGTHRSPQVRGSFSGLGEGAGLWALMDWGKGRGVGQGWWAGESVCCDVWPAGPALTLLHVRPFMATGLPRWRRRRRTRR